MKIILFLSLVVLCTSKNHLCLNSTKIKDRNVCIYETDDTNYYRPCPLGEVCSRKAIGSDNSLTYCEKFNTLKYHDEHCDIDAECLTKKCVDNKCTGKGDFESCEQDYECGKESFCSKYDGVGFCSRYATKDEICNDDTWKCAFGYICVSTNDGSMKCREQFSVKAGGKASDSSLCESGYSLEGICYDYRMKDNKELQVCTSNLDCIADLIDGNGNVVGKKAFGCSVIGPHEERCVPSAQSKQWKNYVKAFKKVRDDIKNNKVHQSILAFGSSSFSPILREAMLDLYYYNVDDCVTDTLSVLLGSGFLQVSFVVITMLFIIIA